MANDSGSCRQQGAGGGGEGRCRAAGLQRSWIGGRCKRRRGVRASWPQPCPPRLLVEHQVPQQPSQRLRQPSEAAEGRGRGRGRRCRPGCSGRGRPGRSGRGRPGRGGGRQAGRGWARRGAPAPEEALPAAARAIVDGHSHADALCSSRQAGRGAGAGGQGWAGLQRASGAKRNAQARVACRAGTWAGLLAGAGAPSSGCGAHPGCCGQRWRRRAWRPSWRRSARPQTWPAPRAHCAARWPGP